jgi:hypothetical protein
LLSSFSYDIEVLLWVVFNIDANIFSLLPK